MMNGCRFTIEHAALAYNSEAIDFPVEGHFPMAGLAAR